MKMNYAKTKLVCFSLLAVIAGCHNRAEIQIPEYVLLPTIHPFEAAKPDGEVVYGKVTWVHTDLLSWSYPKTAYVTLDTPVAIGGEEISYIVFSIDSPLFFDPRYRIITIGRELGFVFDPEGKCLRLCSRKEGLEGAGQLKGAGHFDGSQRGQAILIHPFLTPFNCKVE
jgi:hypothetical protein